MLSSAAALVKLPWRATASKTFMACRGGRSGIAHPSNGLMGSSSKCTGYEENSGSYSQAFQTFNRKGGGIDDPLAQRIHAFFHVPPPPGRHEPRRASSQRA